MSDAAKRRLAALGQQLSPNSSIPPITKIAGASTGPRVEGKVVIITGRPRPLILACINIACL